MVFEIMKMSEKSLHEKSSKIYFSNEESAIQYNYKYLSGTGYVRPRGKIIGKKVYNSLEDYEEDVENQME